MSAASKYSIFAMVNGLQTFAMYFSHVFSPTRAIRSMWVHSDGGKLDVVPQGVHVPAVKVVELGEHADLAELGDGGLDLRDERLVILVVELAAHLEAEDFFVTGGD